MNEFMALAALAIIVERVVEIIKRPLPIESKLIVPISMGVGVLLALTVNADLLVLLGFDAQIPFVGIVSTGLLLSAGANGFNSVLGALNGLKHKAEEPAEIVEGE